MRKLRGNTGVGGKVDVELIENVSDSEGVRREADNHEVIMK